MRRGGCEWGGERRQEAMLGAGGMDRRQAIASSGPRTRYSIIQFEAYDAA